MFNTHNPDSTTVCTIWSYLWHDAS